MSISRRGTFVGAIAVALALVMAPSLPASAAPGPAVTTQESDCTEAAFDRNLSAAAVDPLIPDGYELVPAFTPVGAPPRVQGLINVVTCEQVVLEGPGGASLGRQSSVTYVIYSARLAGGGLYVVSYATDNAVLAARYRQLGWPVDLLGPRTQAASVSGQDGSQQYAWTLQGPGWDGRVAAYVPAELNPVESSGFAAVHKTPDGTVLYLCYANSSSATESAVTFDLVDTPVAALAAIPPLIPNPAAPGPSSFRGTFVVGEWTATLSTEDCPTGPA
ncbi:hypothetical protein [Microbacterium sp. BK668]|uniref:hypothetical protein n=1 Tax=Microbacterium sp. BK668 TaxID=2512118 RepID=UPI00105EF46C|nr:hypothetical protein [Microbacterium sp. BK668]TDN92626.1 hypothetical protein EV279_2152 [Microbacterium sp. BK668]